MKSTIHWMVIAAAVLAGCNKPLPPPEIPVISAGEAMRADDRAIAERLAKQRADTDSAFEQERARQERQQFVDALTPVGRRLSAALDESAGVARKDIDGAIKKMEAIKSDVGAAAINECTTKARDTMLASVSAAIDALNSFKKETGTGSEATQKKFQDALYQMVAYEKQLAVCA